MRTIYTMFLISTIYVFVTFPAFSQAITPVFPAQGATVSFSQLSSEGFQWESTLGNTSYTLFISSSILPSFFPNNTITVNNATSPYTLDNNFSIYFRPGNYEWWVAETGTGKSHPKVPFTIGTNNDLIPTPTPLNRPTPSGDADGSMKIDSNDLFILSTQWGKQTRYYNEQLDLNQDDIIDTDDVLAYVKRYGNSAPAPTPTPPIDRPRNIHFEPGKVVSWAESPDFTILWDKPAYPQNAEFRYDLMVIYPEGYTIEDTIKTNLTETEFKPFPNGITLKGDYIVYLRAKDQNNAKSEINTVEFEVVQSKAATPTPVSPNPDLTGNRDTDFIDVSTFNQSFGAMAGDKNYNPKADFFTDGIINYFDLIIFHNLYLKRNEELAVPTWTSANVPQMNYVSGYPPCEIVERNILDFTQGDPKQITLGTDDGQCALAALNGPTMDQKGMSVSFSPVEGAQNYEITIRSNSQPQTQLTFDTKGKTQDVPIRWTLTIGDDQLFVTVRAIHPDGSKSEPSEELILVLP